MSELLIVLGKNIGEGSSPEDIRQSPDHLSDLSRLTAEAAATIYSQRNPNSDTTILLSGGHTAGVETPTEATAMKGYLLSKHPEIPASRLLTEDVSIDTAGNAEEVAKLLHGGPNYDHIDLLSVGFHVLNAAKLFRRYGVPIDQTYASDEVYASRSERDAAYIHDWFGSPAIQKELKNEKIRSGLLHTIDRRGKLLRVVTKLTRG